MSKKYTNCSACGGLCYYPSRNFENVDIKVSAISFTDLANELKYAIERVNYLEQLLYSEEKKHLLGSLSIDDLWKMFLIKSRGFELVSFKQIMDEYYPRFDIR